MQNLPIIYRKPTPTDLNFVMSSWLRSARNNDQNNYISNQDYYHHYANQVTSLLKRSLVSMVVNEADHDQIYGYIVCEPNNRLIHYLYMKPYYRGFGLAKDLVSAIFPDLGANPITLTEIDETKEYITEDRITKEKVIRHDSVFIKVRKKHNLIFNPFLIGEE